MVDDPVAVWRRMQEESEWARRIVTALRVNGDRVHLTIVCDRGCAVGRFWTMPDERIAAHVPGVPMSSAMFTETISSPTGRRPERAQYRLLDGAHDWRRINNPLPAITNQAIPDGVVLFECRHAQRRPLVWSGPESGLRVGGKITLATP